MADRAVFKQTLERNVFGVFLLTCSTLVVILVVIYLDASFPEGDLFLASIGLEAYPGGV